MSRKLFASLLMACVLAAGFLGIAAVGNAASAGKSIRKSGESGRNYVLENKRGRRGPRIPLPIGPSYLYYDYPYYYSRGHYPTHIGGYVYYPDYSYSRSYYGGPRTTCRQRARRHWWR